MASPYVFLKICLAIDLGGRWLRFLRGRGCSGSVQMPRQSIRDEVEAGFFVQVTSFFVYPARTDPANSRINTADFAGLTAQVMPMALIFLNFLSGTSPASQTSVIRMLHGVGTTVESNNSTRVSVSNWDRRHRERKARRWVCLCPTFLPSA